MPIALSTRQEPEERRRVGACAVCAAIHRQTERTITSVRSTMQVQHPRLAMIIRSRNWKRRYAQAPSTGRTGAHPAPQERKTEKPDHEPIPYPSRDTGQPRAVEQDES
jgi:hypothetical protein